MPRRPRKLARKAAPPSPAISSEGRDLEDLTKMVRASGVEHPDVAAGFLFGLELGRRLGGAR
jgi:hypothetical protein